MYDKSIINEFDKLKFEQQKIIVHALFDKLLDDIPIKQKTISEPNAFKKYRGIAKGFWNIDAQEYINNLRNEDRF